MMRKWPHRILYWSLAMCLVVLGGCAERNAHSRFYMLDTVRQAAPAEAEGKGVVEVPRFTIDAAYAGRRLVYRLDEHRYESDAYHEFLIAPTVMITERTRDWLAETGLFAQVLGSGSRAEATHRIEANVTALYGDFRDKRAPKAVVEVRFFVLHIASGVDPEIVFAKPYRAVCDMATVDPEGVIAGFDRCLQTILGEFERDLADAL